MYHLKNQLLVNRIGKRIDQTDSYRFYTLGQQSFNSLSGISPVQWFLDFTVAIYSFIHFHAKIPLHQWWRFFPFQIVQSRHTQRTQFQYIPKPLGGDQPGPGTGHLQYGVRGNRGAMHDLRHGEILAVH